MLEGLGMSTASSWVYFQPNQGHVQPERLRFVMTIILEAPGGWEKGHTPRNFSFPIWTLDVPYPGTCAWDGGGRSSLPQSERQGDLRKDQNNGHSEFQSESSMPMNKMEKKKNKNNLLVSCLSRS